MLKEGEYKILTGDNVRWEDDNHYRAMLSFCMACCEFLDNLGDMVFINTLPMTMEEFHNQPSHIKDRLAGIIKIHISHFDSDDAKILTGDKADKLDRYHQASLDSIKKDNQQEIEDLISSMLPSSESKPEPSPIKLPPDAPPTEPTIDHPTQLYILADDLRYEFDRKEHTWAEHLIDVYRWASKKYTYQGGKTFRPEALVSQWGKAKRNFKL